MRKFLCLILLFSGISVMAQHKATISPTSDFKTVKSNMIVSEFTLDGALSAAETAEITSWVKANASLMTLTIDGVKLKFSVTPEYNGRDVYEKFFLQTGIDTLTSKAGGTTKTMTIAEFFALYGL